MTEHEKIITRLLALYPDKKVISLSSFDNKLYRDVRSAAHSTNQEMNEFLIQIGFNVVRKKRVEQDNLNSLEEEIVNEILQIYPDKNIGNISVTNKDLYYKINQFCKKVKIKKDEFYEMHGFSKAFSSTANFEEKDYKKTRYSYDVPTMHLLVKSYNFTVIDLGNVFGVTKQNIDSKIKRGSSKYDEVNEWLVDEFDEVILKFFEEMIDTLSTKYENSKAYYQIGSDLGKEDYVFLFVDKEHKNVQCLNNIPTTLKDKLKRNNYNLLKSVDLENVAKASTGEELEAKELDALKRIHEKVKDKYGVQEDFEDFFAKFNINLNKGDKRKLSDEDIKNLLFQFYLPEHDVIKIPLDAPEYHRIMNLASSRGYTIESFCELYGFKYKRIVDRANQKEKTEKTLVKILARYIIEGNKIYISSDDRMYRSLTARAVQKGVNLTKYLEEEFGYERIENKRDLPENYIPFDWRTFEADLSKEDDFKDYIDDNCILIDDENFIYINLESYFYDSLVRYAKNLGITLTELVSKWGYTRLTRFEAIQLLEKHGESEKVSDIKHQENREEFKETDDDIILDILDNIQNEVKQFIDKEEKNSRSQRLVTLMKQLYNYECQLCSDDVTIPKIEMANGKNYVEMHHIIHLSETSAEDESYKLLDNYQNAIVVCPHHHKVLHYYHGGFKEIIEEEDNQLYFVNDTGKLKITKNKHIKLNSYIGS